MSAEVAHLPRHCADESCQIQVGFVEFVVLKVPDVPEVAVKRAEAGTRKRGEDEKVG